MVCLSMHYYAYSPDAVYPRRLVQSSVLFYQGAHSLRPHVRNTSDGPAANIYVSCARIWWPGIPQIHKFPDKILHKMPKNRRKQTEPRHKCLNMVCNNKCINPFDGWGDLFHHLPSTQWHNIYLQNRQWPHSDLCCAQIQSGNISQSNQLDIEPVGGESSVKWWYLSIDFQSQTCQK